MVSVVFGIALASLIASMSAVPYISLFGKNHTNQVPDETRKI
jgi:hypothetical protein